MTVILHICTIPLAIIYSQVSEWIIHKYVLHGLGKKKGSHWSFHWHAHHKKCRKNDFYDEDYKIFFKNFEKKQEKINFYYYDGEHSYKNQYENLEIADNFLDKGSIVLIDDINFSEVENGTKDFLSRTKSSYKILKDIRTANNHCHPSFWNGIMILEKQ